jgi:hypothetical protein
MKARLITRPPLSAVDDFDTIIFDTIVTHFELEPFELLGQSTVPCHMMQPKAVRRRICGIILQNVLTHFEQRHLVMADIATNESPDCTATQSPTFSSAYWNFYGRCIPRSRV